MMTWWSTVNDDVEEDDDMEEHVQIDVSIALVIMSPMLMMGKMESTEDPKVLVVDSNSDNDQMKEGDEVEILKFYICECCGK